MRNYLFALIALIFLVSVASGAEIIITNETGNTWIKWEWQYNAPHDIYIDGKLLAKNTSVEHWILSDINPEEKHSILVVDGENTGYSEVSTLPLIPMRTDTVIFIVVALALIVVGALTGGWIFTIMAVFPATVALYQYLTYYNDVLMLLFVGFVWVASFGVGITQYRSGY